MSTDSTAATDRAKLDELLAQDTVDIRIDRLVEGGLGFGRLGRYPFLVPRAAAGDLLRVRLTDRKRDYARAEIVEVLEPGPDRIEPRCPVYERCGGCDLQHLRVDRQAQIKADAAVETLRRLGGIELDKPKVVAGGAFGYRTRAQLQVRGGGNELDIGFFERGSKELVPTVQCPVLAEGLERKLGPILVALREESEAAMAASTDEASAEEGSGSQAADDSDGRGVPSRLDVLLGDDDELTTAPATENLPHRPVLRQVGAFQYELDARCFFQSHASLALELVELAVGDEEGQTVFELHAGVGLFSLPLAQRYAQVYSVESDRIAGRYLVKNAKRNAVTNITAMPVSAEHFLDKLDKKPNEGSDATAGEPTPTKAERWFVDPPRTGLSKSVVSSVCRHLPDRVTYVSCQPPTLARDLRQLHRYYEVDQVTFVDLFPQTAHIETVVQLRVRSEPLPPPETTQHGARRKSPKRGHERRPRRDAPSRRGPDPRARRSRDPRGDSKRPRQSERGARSVGTGDRSRSGDRSAGGPKMGRQGVNFGGGWAKKRRAEDAQDRRSEDLASPPQPKREQRPERPTLRREQRASAGKDDSPKRVQRENPWDTETVAQIKAKVEKQRQRSGDTDDAEGGDSNPSPRAEAGDARKEDDQ